MDIELKKDNGINIEYLANVIEGDETNINKTINEKIVQETGESTDKVMSQKAVTNELNNIATTTDNAINAKIVQETGESTDKVMSQKAITNELNYIKQSLDRQKINVVQESGNSTTDVMSQKAVTEAVNSVDKVLHFDGFIEDATISLQKNPYDGGKIYFVKSKNKFAYYREEDGIYTAMWNGYDKYATFVSGSGVIPNLDTLFINDSKVYIWNGETLVRVGSESNDGIPKFSGIVQRATITNSTSFSDEGEVVYVVSTVGIDNVSPIFALKINNVYYRSWGGVYDYMTSDLSSPISNKIFEHNKQNYIYEDGSLELLHNGCYWESL
jgi:hypothetical protein